MINGYGGPQQLVANIDFFITVFSVAAVVAGIVYMDCLGAFDGITRRALRAVFPREGKR